MEVADRTPTPTLIIHISGVFDELASQKTSSTQWSHRYGLIFFDFVTIRFILRVCVNSRKMALMT